MRSTRAEMTFSLSSSLLFIFLFGMPEYKWSGLIGNLQMQVESMLKAF